MLLEIHPDHDLEELEDNTIRIPCAFGEFQRRQGATSVKPESWAQMNTISRLKKI